MHATLPLLSNTTFPALIRRSVEVLQVNLGYRCNQSCLHCHVNAGPQRREEMTAETVDAVLAFISASPEVRALDLTGGAPELNPHFRRLVVAGRQRGLRVIDRCNLTILEEPGHEDLADFLATHRIEVVASLPCYLEENVEQQRGKGSFAASIRGLQRLNALGYGVVGSGLQLNLVFNPQGPTLPPPQAALAMAYREHLGQRFGIVFNQLFTLANMPIQRFGSVLVSRGQFNGYMQLLRAAHREENVTHVMCRNLLSVDWQGYLYDCDFNQQLGLPIGRRGSFRLHISDIDAAALEGQAIRVAEHCYGCTAGQGSSCAGALGDEPAPAPSCGT
ncbi:arsenosugar biosynthesis radical SAM (seleno)protein ArsS [Accumulibacter sp.]|uniref:arsenosugar biosynthesis radical SAM (seleno)protein ArsS n=1 Tax=Accumulibacter sp. TaxID=2053492 RepID=UPI001AC7F6C6|nr:arsenosugar biosynthesis radical SAM (seleno)protein ArsS [Accumulibacter sp.]MBN8453727.1 arsenosugar biosynthesis radical SAM protein ArsS [Accumulibacter sp.]MBO3708328.1 arsenosugar biosynthesis radical SAM protein ArsS [Candidatus Accumulibacter conexus]